MAQRTVGATTLLDNLETAAALRRATQCRSQAYRKGPSFMPRAPKARDSRHRLLRNRRADRHEPPFPTAHGEVGIAQIAEAIAVRDLDAAHRHEHELRRQVPARR